MGGALPRLPRLSRRALAAALAGAVLLGGSAPAGAQSRLVDAPPSLPPTRVEQHAGGLRHAYYLFRSGPSEGCAECYVPLLLAAQPITTSTDGVEVIVTFERDSIWAIRNGPAEISEVAPLPRTLRLDGRPYRYQEVPLDEAIRLLRNPLGSIPISRPMLPDSPTPSRRRALLLRLGASD